MWDFFSLLLLGVMEGITEFLPISSTAHLLIVEQLLGVRKSDMFNVVIQSGAVVAVIPAFWSRVRDLVLHASARENRDYLAKLFTAFGITGVGGVIMEECGFKLPESMIPVAIALLVGGILFLFVEWQRRGKDESDKVTWPIALCMGVAQLIAACFPGVSRSGACIILALWMGLTRQRATEFAFLLGVPTMLAAGGLKLVKALLHGMPGTEPISAVLLGFVVAAVASFLAVKWLIRYVQTHSFIVFGWYRIAFGIVIFAIWIIKQC